MGDSSVETEGNLDRRRFIRKAAIVGGTAWAVPMLVTMKPAGAATLTSPPPTGVGGEEETPPVPGQNDQPTQVLESSASNSGNSGEALPRTGADIDKLIAAGLTAVAGGTGLTLWSAQQLKAVEAAAADNAISADPRGEKPRPS